VTQRVDLRGRSLRVHAARGTIINTAFMVGLAGLGLLKGFILATFLNPADYGVWGILVVSLGTLLFLKQVGISDKYIQQDEEDQELAFQKAFTLEAMIMGAFVVLLAASLPLFAAIYGQPEIILPGLVVLAILPAAALQVPIWVFYRRMQFVRQRSLQAIDPVVGFVVTIALAAAGAGYWALVIGVVAGYWAAAVAAVISSPYRLALRYDRGTLREYAGFSWPLFVNGMGGMVIAQGSFLLTEAHFGLAGAGAVALAATITQFTERVDFLITGTLYPAICAVKDRVDLLYESFVKSNRLALIWAVPFGLTVTLFAGDLVTFGIGEKWRESVVLLQVFGVTAGLAHIGFNWDAYFRARANTRPMAVAAAAAAVAFLATAVPLTLTYEMPGFAASIAIQAAVHVSVRAYFLERLFQGFGFLGHALRAVLPTVPAVAVVLLLRLAEPMDRTLAVALGELCLYVGVTVAATWYLEKRLLREVVGYVLTRRPAGAPA
jgi:O-antigen/teichoic acid export membrane protein